MEASPETVKVPKKWVSMVRVKPLSEKEIINVNEKEKDKFFKNAEGNTVTMKYSRGDEKFTFDKVIHPDED